MGHRATTTFENNHRWDRNFFLAYVVMIWLGILMGFVPEIIGHVERNATPYPAIVHFHAIAFVGWLILLTVQVLLIRAHRADIHRELGIAGVFLAGAMVVLGPVTAIVVDGLRLGKPDSDPAFLSIQLTDIVSFAGLVTAAIAMRHRPAAHKRLMLLTTLFISDAGFARWLSGHVSALLGDGFWGTFAQLYSASDSLIAGLGIYDLWTRRRLHPVYLPGVAWGLANQLTAVGLYFSPTWQSIALRLISH
ncbi:MAG: hypothetical protein ACHQIL_03330 [Steroidobacterales bacterium]